MTPSIFAAQVHAYCARFNASETSGYRTHAHNLKVGGKPGSPHRFGLARYVVYDTTPPLEVAQRWATSRGIEIIREDTHDHLQPEDWINHPELDTA